MKGRLKDNCYGDAQVPDSPEELANRLRQLRKDRYEQDGLNVARRHARTG